MRIAFTVAEYTLAKSKDFGVLQHVIAERAGIGGVPDVTLATTAGQINADLSIGSNPDLAKPLRATERISCPGVKLHGAGFIVSSSRAVSLGLGKIPGLERHLRRYLNGHDLTQRSRGMMVIDLFGLSEQKVRSEFPAVYEHVLLNVKPERDENRRAVRRTN